MFRLFRLLFARFVSLFSLLIRIVAPALFDSAVASVKPAKYRLPVSTAFAGAMFHHGCYIMMHEVGNEERCESF